MNGGVRVSLNQNCAHISHSSIWTTWVSLSMQTCQDTKFLLLLRKYFRYHHKTNIIEFIIISAIKFWSCTYSDLARVEVAVACLLAWLPAMGRSTQGQHWDHTTNPHGALVLDTVQAICWPCTCQLRTQYKLVNNNIASKQWRHCLLALPMNYSKVSML